MRTRNLLRAVTIALLALYIAGAVALGSLPKGDDDGTKVVAWFADHHGNVRAALWFTILSAIAFAWFAALIRNRLPAPHRDVFFFGAIALAAETAVQSWLLGGLAWHHAQLEPATARTLLDVASFWGPVLTSTTVLVLAPIALLAWREQAGLPKWLGVVAGIALIEQLVETVTVFGDSGFIEPGGAMNLILGAGLTLIAFGAIGFAIPPEPVET